MTTINDLIVRAARDLNDYTDEVPNKQFQRWTQEQLLGYWNEALCVMYTLNPSKFKCAKVAKLKPGINQVFDECKRVLSVIGVSDQNGNVLYEIEKDTDDKKLKWGGYRPRHCTTFTHNRDFKLTSYRILTDKDGSVMVKPAVPYGTDVHLKFMCETPPREFEMNNLSADIAQSNCIDVTMGVHWVLFRALMVDEESQSSNSLASQHLNLFFKLLEVKTETDKDSNYNLEGLPAVLKQLVAREVARYQLGIK
jgi:hypothetical protein